MYQNCGSWKENEVAGLDPAGSSNSAGPISYFCGAINNFYLIKPIKSYYLNTTKPATSFSFHDSEVLMFYVDPLNNHQININPRKTIEVKVYYSDS